MDRRLAAYAILAAGIQARLVLSDEPDLTDDEIILNGNESVCVQISATRDGLRFSASVASGAGDSFCVRHGKMHANPVAAARDAIRIHAKES